MENEISENYLLYEKLKILYVNIFIIILKVVTLNPYKWLDNMNHVHVTIREQCEICWGHQILVNIILLYLIMKFFLGYATLASNIIAIFPILTDDMPNLLLPSMLSQTFEHIILCLIEFLLGLAVLKYYNASRLDTTVAFIINIIIKIAIAVAALNSYSDFYNKVFHYLMYS